MEEDEYYDSSSASVVPNNVRTLRACLICGLVKTAEQFSTSGCPNCDIGDATGDYVSSCTTPNFEGMIAVIEPQKSWVAKWQRTRNVL
jgi:transcription elongation factor SPT4